MAMRMMLENVTTKNRSPWLECTPHSVNCFSSHMIGMNSRLQTIDCIDTRQFAGLREFQVEKVSNGRLTTGRRPERQAEGHAKQ